MPRKSVVTQLVHGSNQTWVYLCNKVTLLLYTVVITKVSSKANSSEGWRECVQMSLSSLFIFLFKLTFVSSRIYQRLVLCSFYFDWLSSLVLLCPLKKEFDIFSRLEFDIYSKPLSCFCDGQEWTISKQPCLNSILGLLLLLPSVTFFISRVFSVDSSNFSGGPLDSFREL